MTREGLVTAVCLTAALGAAAGPPEVSVDGLEVRILADGSRLDELLAALSEATGMQVSYEASPPDVSVTAQLHAPSHAEAVIRLLDGLAVSYAVQLDASGERVTRLWIAGDGRKPRARPRAAAPPTRPERRRPPPPAPVSDAESEPDEDGRAAEATDPVGPMPVLITPQACPTPLMMPTPPPIGPTPTPAPDR